MKFRKVVAATVMVLLFMGGACGVALAGPSGAPEAAQRRDPGALAVLAYIAGKSGASLDDLVAEFKEGKSLEEIAQEHGLDWSAVEEAFARKGRDKEAAIERLRERLARLTENRSKIAEHLARLQERIARLEERISTMQDETMKGFALRLLDILEERLALGQERAALLEREIELVQEMLEYVSGL